MVTFTKEQLVCHLSLDIYKRATCHHCNQKVTSTSLQVSLRKRRPRKDNLIEPIICFKQKWVLLAHHITMKQLQYSMSIHTYKNYKAISFCPLLGFCSKFDFMFWFVYLFVSTEKSFWVAARLFKAVVLPACSTDQSLFECVCVSWCLCVCLLSWERSLNRGQLLKTVMMQWGVAEIYLGSCVFLCFGG